MLDLTFTTAPRIYANFCGCLHIILELQAQDQLGELWKQTPVLQWIMDSCGHVCRLLSTYYTASPPPPFFLPQWTYLCAWKWTFVIPKVLVNVNSQYAYLITCLCTPVQLAVHLSGCCWLYDRPVCGGSGVLCLSFCFCFYKGNSFCVFLWAHCAPAFSSGLCTIEISCIIIII